MIALTRSNGIVVAGILLCVLSRAAAQAPRISLDLHQVTLSQAAAALQKASGQQVIVAGPEAADRGPASAPELHDIHWMGVTFGAALRSLCVEYHVQCGRRRDGYGLYPLYPTETSSPRDTIAPPPGAPAFRSPAGRMFLTSTEWVNQGPADPRASWPSLGLNLMAKLNRREIASLIRLENVVAKDDRGNLLTGQFLTAKALLPVYPSAFPGHWLGKVDFPFADSRARKLAWLQGDLIADSKSTTRQLELPWVPGYPGFIRRPGGFLVEVVCSSHSTVPRPGDPAAGPYVEVSVFGKHAGRRGGRSMQLQSVELVGASGRIYQAADESRGFSLTNGQVINLAGVFFPPITEPVAKLRIRFREEGGRVRLFHFRIANVSLLPLPTEASRQKTTKSGVDGPTSAKATPGTRLSPDLPRTPPPLEAVRPPVPAVLTAPTSPAPFAGPPVFENRSLRMYRPGCEWMAARRGDDRRLAIDLPLRLLASDAVTITGLANVVARDDRGNLIPCYDQNSLFPAHSYRSAKDPSLWAGRLEFSLPDPCAKRLVWIEGDVIGSRNKLLASLVLIGIQQPLCKFRLADVNIPPLPPSPTLK